MEIIKDQPPLTTAELERLAGLLGQWSGANTEDGRLRDAAAEIIFEIDEELER